MVTSKPGADTYRTRRKAILDKLGGDAVAVVAGGPGETAMKVFRQTNDFYYLTGVESPQSYLVLDGRSRAATLFLPHQTEKERDGEGPMPCVESADEVIAQSGVDAVKGTEKLSSVFERIGTIYTPLREGAGFMTGWDSQLAGRNGRFGDPWDGTLERYQRFVELLRSRHPQAQIADLIPLINGLRGVKDGHEIDLLRRAGKLSALGINEAIRSTAPGLYEYQLAAAIEYIYLNHGARSCSYTAIIASGPNAWHGHYMKNSSILVDGDLVLGDCAPDYQYYSSDICRMWPVNGKYTDEQRLLYGFMVEYHKTFLALIRPGLTDEEIRLQAAAKMEKVAAKIDWKKPAYEKAVRWTLDFPYHMSHPVGLACHDDGHYRGKPLVPGIVIALDPQMKVDEERKYIRVEDTIVVTEDGCENMTKDAPLELDEIEALMKEPGMVQRYPADAFPLLPSY